MDNFTDIILKNRLGEMTKAERDDFKRNLVLNEQLRKEYSFHEKLDNVLKHSLLLESIENDPDLIKADILSQNDIDQYLKKGRNTIINGNAHTIGIDEQVDLRKKIAKAEVEMLLTGIDVNTEFWAREFVYNKKSITCDPSAQKIFNYVKESMLRRGSVVMLPSVGQVMTRKIGFSVAAAVLVLSMLMVKSLTSTYSGNSVYSKYYEPLEANSYRLRGNLQEGVENKLNEGIDFYLSKDYAKAGEAFDQIQDTNGNQSEVALFSGMNNMEQGNFDEAITSFSGIISTNEMFVPEAQWYLGLCFIKTGETQKAIPIMEALSKTEGIYKDKALQILSNFTR